MERSTGVLGDSWEYGVTEVADTGFGAGAVEGGGVGEGGGGGCGAGDSIIGIDDRIAGIAGSATFVLITTLGIPSFLIFPDSQMRQRQDMMRLRQERQQHRCIQRRG